MNITVGADNIIYISADEIASFARTRSAVSRNAFGFSPIAAARSEDSSQIIGQSVSLPLTIDGATYSVVGSVDRAIIGHTARLEFIKSYPRRIRGTAPLTDPHFAAAALLRAYIFCESEDCRSAEIIITYYNEASGESASFSTVLDVRAMSELFSALWKRAFPFIKHSVAAAIQAKKQFAAMHFPFPSIRDPQRELIKESFLAIAKGRHAIVSAPTGTGKTMSVLYSSLKAIGAGYADKLFYLTAKASTGKAAADAAAIIAKSCPELRVITIYAKERLCPEEARPRNACAVFCPRLDELDGEPYEKRRDSAMLELLKKPIISAAELSEAARKHKLCPYELSLDLSEYAHMVICDYNYVFDERIRFKRYFKDKLSEKKYIFAIDEAHNLPTRVRSTYSSQISRSELTELRSAAKEAFPDDRELNEACAQMLEAIDASASEISIADESNRLAYSASAELPKGLEEAAARLRSAIARRIKSDGEYAEACLGDAYAKLTKLLVSTSAFSRGFRALITRSESDILIQLLLLDPSELIANALKLSHSSILFSATLAPTEYFAAQFGVDNAEILELPSPYEKDNLAIVAYDGISTRYADRMHTATDAAEIIAAVTDARIGNYLVYFPSYEYMKRVYRVYREIAPYSRIICQRSKMDLRARDRFLQMFGEGDEPTVGFCVLGGIFSEGIDLAGDRLIGSIIVGLGMGAISSEDNLMKEYYGEDGAKFAYIYPGINRVLQAAGRVIRSENDRGVVVLIDDRYNDQAVQRLLPKHMRHMRLVGDTEALSRVLDEFWSSDR